MTPSEFAARVAEFAAGRPRVVVGICGAPGAGKSTLAESTAAALAPDAVVLPMDGFHLPQARLVALGRRDRMGAPDTFDVDAFVATLEEIRFSGGLVLAPGFDRAIEEPVPGQVSIPPEKRVVLVEGNYLLHDRDGWERVAPLLDLTAYVDEDDELRRERLIARHIAFGKTPDAARAWVLGPDEANARLIAA
jgi:pantothenate kinase